MGVGTHLEVKGHLLIQKLVTHNLMSFSASDQVMLGDCFLGYQ